jgi:hypothetical protein
VSAEFTPGPWVVAYHDSNGQAVVSGKHTEVCTCWHHSVGSIVKQMRANAHLIAAAPDLYSAATDALAGWRYIRAQHGDLDGVGWDRVEQALTEALAKAVQS